MRLSHAVAVDLGFDFTDLCRLDSDVEPLVDAAAMKRKRSCPETGPTSQGTSGALFDVFLSFRGPDTRANFTDFLYHALLDKGIHVFIDKKEIDVGDEIGPEIFQAINDSKICIPIFSRGYASSSWCLRELEHMMKRRKTNDLKVMPIFYDVEPSDVKLETRVYRDALTLHEETRGAEIVQRWTKALKEVTRTKGWDTKNTGHGEFTRFIACEISGKLDVSPVHLSNHLVGIDRSVDEVLDLLSIESQDIRLIGLCGIGGIGKTTHAKVVYHKLSTTSDSCSFIPDIREASESSNSGLLNLQKRLVHDILGDKGIEISSIDQGKNIIKERFRRKKVLIFLDDVNHKLQLMALAAEGDWFGLGSRIVITMRDKSVLSGFQNHFGHCLIYEAKELNNLEALQLFSKYAFKSNSPPNALLSLSHEVVAKTGGLPLAIEVIGSFLYGKKEVVWRDTLKKMEHCPHKDVKEKLMLSYEALDYQQRQIFLDIACFLVGENERYANYMWEDCEFFPNEGIDVLLSMSLVKITETNQLWMHDQIKDLGRSIVYQENCGDPGKRSRVWNHKEALDMILKKKGTKSVVAICVKFYALRRDNVLTSRKVRKVPNIRFLKMFGGDLFGDFESHFSELRWLSWHCCPTDLQATNFCPNNLLILDLSRSPIDEHWGGWTQLKVATRLKVLNLSMCLRLRTTPDLSAYLSLEILILEDCKKLLRIDQSIGHLRCLRHMNLNGCFDLGALPVELGALKTLTELLIDTTDIRQVPSSIGELVNLKCLSLCGTYKLRTLPNLIGMLKCLVELDISNTYIAEFPNTIVNLSSLKVLKMNKSCMQKLPKAIAMLEKLEEIYGEDCKRLEMIPDDIVTLPILKILKLTETRLEKVPRLPQSLVSLCLSSTASRKAPEISNLVNLRNLELGFTSIVAFRKERTYSPYCMLALQSITSIGPYLGCLRYLRELELNNCKNLCKIGQLPSSLRKLTVNNCDLLEAVDLSNLSNFKNLKDLEVWDCPKLVKIQGLDKLESLESLYIGHCSYYVYLIYPTGRS